MADAKIEYLIAARDEATKVFNAARSKIERNLKGFERSFTELQSKMSFMGQAGRVALDSISAGAKLLKGDMAGAVTLIESLPLGIGEVAAAIHRITDELSGAREEMEKMKELNDDFARRQKNAGRFAGRGLGPNASLEDIIQNTMSQSASFGQGALSKSYVAAQDAIGKIFEKAFDPANPDFNQETLRLAARAGKIVDDHYKELFQEADRIAIDSLREQSLEAERNNKKLLQRLADMKYNNATRQTIGGSDAASALLGGGGLAPGGRFTNAELTGPLMQLAQQQAGGMQAAMTQAASRFMQASPLAPVVEGSRLTGRTAAAQAERQAEFVKRQNETQQKQLRQEEKNGKVLGDILGVLKGKPALSIIGIGN